LAREKDYYRILQLDPSAEPEVIEAAYKRLASMYHPDLNQSADAGERMRDINEAHSVLSDEARRRDYDYRTRGTRSRSEGSSGASLPATPLWLRRLWFILGIVGLLALIRLNFRVAIVVAAGWLLSAMFRKFYRKRKR
jgi:curved DNA-binding protein CbpA